MDAFERLDRKLRGTLVFLCGSRSCSRALLRALQSTRPLLSLVSYIPHCSEEPNQWIGHFASSRSTMTVDRIRVTISWPLDAWISARKESENVHTLNNSPHLESSTLFWFERGHSY